MDELERIREKKMQEMAARNDWPSEPVNVNDDNINDFIRRYGLALVDCWAPWCGPCRMMAPAFEQAGRQLNGRALLVKVNSDDNPGLSARFGIRSIPTLALFRGGREVARQAGAMGAADIVRWVRGQLG